MMPLLTTRMAVWLNHCLPPLREYFFTVAIRRREIYFYLTNNLRCRSNKWLKCWRAPPVYRDVCVQKEAEPELDAAAALLHWRYPTLHLSVCGTCWYWSCLHTCAFPMLQTITYVAEHGSRFYVNPVVVAARVHQMTMLCD